MAHYQVQNSLPSNSTSARQGKRATLDPSLDLTDERDLMIERLREAVAARDDFLAVATHELRSPLTAIQARIELLRRAERNGNHQQIAAQLEPLASVLDQFMKRTELLLNTAQLNAGKLRLELSRFDLSRVITEVLDGHGALLKRCGSGLSANIEPDVIVWLDAFAATGIMENLLSNAIKYGQGKPIEVTLKSLEDKVLIAVRDHGNGIAAADTERIFERFERAVAPRPRPGFGIGLWVSRNLVQAMGGSIDVMSTTGAGSVFTVTLPIDGRRTNER
jgi:two-component system OmpR family sensor kinase